MNQRQYEQTRPHRSLAGALRWFSAEFLVVVLGVLVALALNAYYQGRVDAQREADYLDQLAADLRESEAALQGAVSGNEAELEKILTLMRFFGRQGVPAPDEYRDLITLNIRPDQPTLSTAQAVVDTGDLRKTRTPTKSGDEAPCTQVMTIRSVLSERSAEGELASIAVDWVVGPEITHEKAPGAVSSGKVEIRRALPGYRLFPQFLERELSGYSLHPALAQIGRLEHQGIVRADRTVVAAFGSLGAT